MKPSPPDIARAATAQTAPSWHRLWQVPVFVLGVCAFLAVWFWPPSGPNKADQRARQHLLASLQAVEEGDGPAALNAARSAWEQGGLNPQLAGDIRYALGAAYLLSAGKSSEFDAATADRRARADLELAQQVGVSPSLGATLLLRLAQARQRTGAEPSLVVPLLQQSAEQNPRCAEEAYALLVELYLHRQPPQWKAALEVTEKWLLLPVLRQPNVARLRRGELLLSLERRDEARQTLSRIPEIAAEFPRARLLAARSHFEEAAYAKAAELWHQAVKDGRPAESMYHVRLMLGLCHAEQGPRAEAEQVWQPLLEAQPRLPETLPAWLRLAELRLDANETNGALIAFDEALRDCDRTFPNPYLDSVQVRERLDKAWRRWRQTGNYSAAKRLLEIARAVLPAGVAEERIGLTCQEAGQSYLTQAGKATGAKAEGLMQQAQQHFRMSGEAYAKAASLNSDTNEETELLWKAAQNLLRGQSYARAVTVLETYLSRDLPAQQRTEAIIGLGEALQAVQQSDRAVQLLTQALEQPHPLEQRARYLLALAYIDQKKFAEAEKILRDIATSKTLSQGSQEHPQSRFAIGHVKFRQKKFAEAVTDFDAALQQFPDDPGALAARHLLAEACMHTARQQVQHYKDAKQEAARDYYSKQRRHYYELGLKHFQKLAQDLSDRQEQSPLSTNEQALLRGSRFGMGDCLFQLGRAQEAVSVYESLALHHNNQPEGLTALMHLTQCHLHLQRCDDAKQVLVRIETLLGTLSDTQLSFTYMTRPEWNEWITWAKKACVESGSE
jgi:tetratricopeptide (TPR) repeat protein